MTARKISLKVITAPATGLVLDAPPILQEIDQSVDYTCGQCGTILLHAEESRALEHLPNAPFEARELAKAIEIESMKRRD
jgi:hypothetical protein